ncbi:peptidoglycan editing factor PgeF [Bacillaceae bacterium SIJ1]|uniref:peptidoglycan editing factor PgeF n=1 Tax=Litoribacterium kuwaitense TaxID=1398745 RepID=UPI0013ECF8F2|nr:peptidoglycan editing factor PgeF [Litoribacterium kuwaitense]NGP44330.1 peptidoglycan editing factor PgeF [Litoribacterium kuwaitense]
MVSDLMQLRTSKALPLFYWPRFQDEIIAGVTTRQGGTSEAPYDSFNLGLQVGDDEEAVQRHYTWLAKELDCTTKDMYTAKQVHGTTILSVDQQTEDDDLREADGLWTGQAGVVLSLVYADCVPVLVYARNAGRIAVLHAGWRGTVAGIAGRLVELWKTDDVLPEEMYVLVGPAICAQCYQVGTDVAEKVPDQFKEKTLSSLGGGQYLLDLRQLNRRIFMAHGIPQEHIDVSELCTICHSEWLFSHRRSAPTGRHAAFIRMMA